MARHSGRGISTFSERDRVRLRALDRGTEFVWGGARWVVHARDDRTFQVSLRVTGGATARPTRTPQPETRVIVARASGEALRARDASRLREEGDR